LIGRFFSVTGVFSIMSSVESAPSITLHQGSAGAPDREAMMPTADTPHGRDDDDEEGAWGWQCDESAE
jgi:hypothetical protein